MCQKCTVLKDMAMKINTGKIIKCQIDHLNSKLSS